MKLFRYFCVSITFVEASRLGRSLNSTSLSSTNLNSTSLNSTSLKSIAFSDSTTTDDIKHYYCDPYQRQWATQAINDAVTMVQTVRSVDWTQEEYRPVFEKYMGTDCLGNSLYVDWIKGRPPPNEWEGTG